MALADRTYALNAIKRNLGSELTMTQLDGVMGIIASTLNQFSFEATTNTETNASYTEWLDAFLSAKEVEGRSQKTIKRYRYCIERFFKAVHTDAGEVNVYHIRKYMTDMKKSGSCDNTISGVKSILQTFFAWCQNEGLITVNPCRNVGSVKVPKLMRKPFSQIDIERMRESCDNLRDKAIIYFLMSTGCRISEVCDLNREDVDLDNLECVVYGKGAKERTVYIDPVTAMTLTRYFSERTDSYQALFVGKGTERMTPGGIRFMLKKLEEKCGVENIHPHRFRRTLATNLIDRGMSIQEVAMILGHEKLDTTMKYVYQSKSKIKNAYHQCAG